MCECAHLMKADQPRDLGDMQLAVVEVANRQIAPQLLQYFSEVSPKPAPSSGILIIGVMRAGMTPATRMLAACSSACWLTPHARGAPACIDRPPAAQSCNHHAENSDHRDCAAADARHCAAIPATTATEAARPVVPDGLDGERQLVRVASVACGQLI